MNRRQFMKTVAAATSKPARRLAVRPRGATMEGRKLDIIGWQLGLTYQAPQPHGVDRDYLMRLLDEMAHHRMNLLSLMMISYGYFDPAHDGYAWPVHAPGPKCYWDAGSINGQPSSEFLRDVIDAAAHRGIKVQLFMNWGIWNPEKIRTRYPDAALQIAKDGRPAGWLHCPDSSGAWQLGMDEVGDLLTYYDHPNVVSYAFERLSYSHAEYCFCRHTQDAYRKHTGASFLDARPAEIEAWKLRHVTTLLEDYVRHLKRIRPDIGVGLHTRCAPGWGHDPTRLLQCGIDHLLPHTIQFPQTKETLHAEWRRLAPNRCVLHFCCRDRRPANYPLWVKTPEIIAQAVDWVLAYPADNLAGLLFFNEVATSPRNKRAIYEQIRRFELSRPGTSQSE